MATDHFTLLGFTATLLVCRCFLGSGPIGEFLLSYIVDTPCRKCMGCQILLTAVASIEVRDEDGGLPLHDACAGGYNEIVSIILRAASSQQQRKRVMDSFAIDGDTCPADLADPNSRAQVRLNDAVENLNAEATET